MGARIAATVRRRLGRERWYDRVGSMPTSNRHGLAVMAAVSGVATDVAVRYDSLGEDAGSVVTLGCGDKQLLEDFCQDLDAVDIGLEWVGPIRVSPPLFRDTGGAKALAAAAERLADVEAAQAAGRERSGASLVVVTERLGHAAASVRPPTPASQRARGALAAAYERMTAERAPF
jgi:hypothetical protein